MPKLQKGWAKGARCLFLDQCLIVYIEKKATNVKKASEYANSTVVNEYFVLFYWALPLDQDPHPDNPVRIADEDLTC